MSHPAWISAENKGIPLTKLPFQGVRLCEVAITHPSGAVLLRIEKDAHLPSPPCSEVEIKESVCVCVRQIAYEWKVKYGVHIEQNIIIS